MKVITSVNKFHFPTRIESKSMYTSNFIHLQWLEVWRSFNSKGMGYILCLALRLCWYRVTINNDLDLVIFQEFHHISNKVRSLPYEFYSKYYEILRSITKIKSLFMATHRSALKTRYQGRPSGKQSIYFYKIYKSCLFHL